MAYSKTTWINDQTELNAENMNHIEDGVEKAYGQYLLAVDSVAPEECTTGDKYYNTEDNKIYTATGTDTWGETGEDAELGIFYIVLETQNIYTYNGETLVSVGGGSGGGDSLPVGTVIAYAGSTAPDGFLLTNGDAVSRITYKDLFRAIGTTYGTGDGSTTFNLPNIKGRTVVMLDSTQTEFDTLGETGGSKNLQSHTHLISANDGGTTSLTASNQLGFYASSGQSDLPYSLRGTSQNATVGKTSSTGTGNSENLQPYIVLNYIIKANKVSQVPETAEVQNVYSTSQDDTYSCNYVNKSFGGTLLWTNPNPTSTFAAQNIQLSSSDYDIYECIYVISSGVNDRYLSSKSVKGKGFILEFYDGYEKKGGTRSISYTDATHLVVQQSYYDGTGSATYCIPEYIIGYKTGLF